MTNFDFIIGLCLIVGGFLTVSSAVESLVRNLLGEGEDDSKKKVGAR